MSQIHASAIIGKNVEIGSGTRVGPHAVIEDHVKIGQDNVIQAGAYLCTGTEIGDRNQFHMNCVVGHEPQDLAFSGAPTFTKIGNDNVIREFSTIHRGTKEGTSTIIGNSNFLMAYTHVAHNCLLGDHIIMVNQASLTGHCIVEDRAFLSGMTGFHQFSRIGKLAMVSALSACNKDIPPFVTCGGRPGVALGINVVGMRRAGFKPNERSEVRQAFKLLYRSDLNVTQAIVQMRKELKSAPVNHLISFIEASKRGIIDGARNFETGSEETLLPKKG